MIKRDLSSNGPWNSISLHSFAYIVPAPSPGKASAAREQMDPDSCMPADLVLTKEEN